MVSVRKVAVSGVPMAVIYDPDADTESILKWEDLLASLTAQAGSATGDDKLALQVAITVLTTQVATE